ncbi:Kinesin heavy chain [Yarrowia sp. B02]|nr:Kinesin heavy chain [Yarrowia sp. B02]
MSTNNNVKVIARFRPDDNEDGNIVSFDGNDTCHIATKDSQSTSFTFDRVFDSASQQADVFEYCLKETVDDLLNGYNGTVFAYGQTGSGKTYTMMGDIDDVDRRGAIPRMVDQIFEQIFASSQDIEYMVKVSYMEIYMEKIRDLLHPEHDNLPIHEDKARGVFVKGLSEEYVSNAAEVHAVMRQGSLSRVVAATNMNQESSRSHSIFSIAVSQKNVASGAQKTGQLFLVDLAGSEKVGKTGASGQTLEEAKKINKSLSALGLVINSLTDGSTHIPYRDSKLTRILQESLGGNSRTSLIINCSPAAFNEAETISTLRFGVRAKSIKNRAKINAELSALELRRILKKCQVKIDGQSSYISRLEEEVAQWRKGETVPKAQWAKDKPAEASNRDSVVSLRSSRPGTPLTPSNRLSFNRRASTPIDQLLSRRSSTVLDSDMIDEYLRRENELQDVLVEKETVICEQDKLLAELQAELARRSEADSETLKLKETLERALHEKKETQVSVDVLKDEVSSLKKMTKKNPDLFGGFLDDNDNINHQGISNGTLGESAASQGVHKSLASLKETLQRLESTEVTPDSLDLLSDQIAMLLKENSLLRQDVTAVKSREEDLVRDIQTRCERIVELEINLDQIKDQHNSAKTKKMALLERNLEKLTHVQREIIEQNNALKKDVEVSKRLLSMRNERIETLEQLLADSRQSLEKETESFQLKLTTLRERMVRVKSTSNRQVRPLQLPQQVLEGDHRSRNSLSFEDELNMEVSNSKRLSTGLLDAAARIVKPLRGGEQSDSK